MNYDYLICGRNVRFVIPWPLKTTVESLPFLTTPDSSGQPDLTVCFSEVDTLALPERGGVWSINSCYRREKGQRQVWHCPVRSEPPYCCVVWNEASPDVITCQYVKGGEQHIVYTRNLLELLGLEGFLLHFEGLILHSSLIAWEGRGILFCAPSGTGKSTQAALWEQYMGSRTLNGDRAGIRCEHGIWKAWGLPFAGTSGIYRNESVPICAVVLLQQGRDNTIGPVRPPEAFKRMLPECSAQRWDAGFMDRLAGILTGLVSSVPVYQLECRPDLDAVRLLRDTILKEE